MSQVLANRCPQQQQQQNQNSSAAGKQNAAAAAAFRHPVPELTVDYVRQSSCFDCEQRTNVTRPTTVESQQSDRQLEPASATPLAGLLRNPNSVVAQSTTMTTTTTHSVDIGCRPAEGGGGGDDDDGKTSRAAHSVGIQLTKSGVACSAGRPSRRHSSAEILELAACSDSSSALLLGTTSIRRSAAAAAAPGSDTWARGLSRQRSASTRVSRAQYGTASAATSSHQPQYYHQHQRQQRQAIQQQQQQHEGAAGAINWLSVPGVSNNNGSNRSSKQMSDAHLIEGGFEMMPMSSSWSSECAPRAASAAAGSFASQRPSGADARHKGAYCVRLTQSFRRPSATTTTAAAAAASGDSTNSGNNKESSAANDRSPSAAPSAVSASSASCAAAGHSDKASARNRAATKCLFSGADAPSSDAHHQPAVVLLQAAGVAAGPAPRLSSSSTSPMASQRDLDWPHHSASAGHYQHARSQSVRVTVSVSRAAGDQLVASRASSSHNKSSACINTSSNANSANSYAFGGSATNSNGAGIIRERDYRCAGAGYQQHQQHQQQQTAPSHSRGTSLPSSKNSSFRGSQAVSMCGSASTAASAAINEPHIVVSGGPSEPYYAGDDQEADYYLLRHFIVHGKNNKVVNRGDSFRRLHHHTQMQQQQQQQQPPPPPPPHQQQQQPQQPQQYQQYQQPLQQQLQAQATAGASRHSSTSSVSTDNATGSPPPSPLARTLTQQHHHHASNQQQLQHQHQQQFQYYCHSDHQSTSSSRRASLLGPWSPGVADQQSSSGLTTSSATNFAPEGPEPFRVLMLGASGVGKTALTAQFMTSEYLNTYEASLDEDSYDRTVSVLLDGEESQLIFIDHPYGEISVENCMSTYNPNAYVVVYSVVDAESLRLAEEALHFLWRHSLIVNAAPMSPSSKTLTVVTSASGSGFPAATSGGSIEGSSTLSSTLANQSLTSTPPLLATTATVTPLLLPPAPPVVILVANKIDLVRSRLISPQAGKSLATSFDCKYIETSSGIQHNVDELLVGILKQIRLRIQMNEQLLSRASSSSSSARSLFRKKSGRRRQQQQRVNFQQQHKQTSDKGADDSEATANEGSCCIVTACSSPHANSGYLGYSPSSCSSTNRRSTSLRVRRMLGKAVWTCAEYYHRNKSRSCEDLHVL